LTAFDPIGRPLDEVLSKLAQQGRFPLIVETRSPLSSQAHDAERSARVIAQRKDALVVAYFDMRSPEADSA
jgi:hypothetical protein